MLKFVNSGIVFQEIPDEVTLSINISNCPCHCPGCHSSYLWEDTGTPLDVEAIKRFVADYGSSITCICMMGGDAEPESVNSLAQHIRKTYPTIKTGWYSGRTVLSQKIDKSNFNYIKTGPYIRHLGPLNKPTTNQRLYKVLSDGQLQDITSRFWKK